MSSKQTSALPKQAVFQAPEDFWQAEAKVQNNIVGVWIAANPACVIRPIEGRIAEGGLPAYLRRDTGKRADINRMLGQPIGVAKFLVDARKLGGGYTDLVAALAGGYSRSAVGYGTPVVQLTALPTN
jgi:hypothetical protein